MGSSYRRLLAAAALVFTMSAIVGLVVVSPLVWRDGSSLEPAPEALSPSGEVASAVAPKKPRTPKARAGQVRPLQSCRGEACLAPESADPPVVGAGYIRPLQRPVISDKKGKAKGHERKGLGSKKAGKHGHHAQGAPGKGHGKGKSKDRDRAPARARG
jgi:hypothetical protein